MPFHLKATLSINDHLVLMPFSLKINSSNRQLVEYGSLFFVLKRLTEIFCEQKFYFLQQFKMKGVKHLVVQVIITSRACKPCFFLACSPTNLTIFRPNDVLSVFFRRFVQLTNRPLDQMSIR